MPLRIELASVTPRRGRLKSAPAQSLVDEFLERAERYTPVRGMSYDSEQALLSGLEKAQTRLPGVFILLDSRGKALTSEAFAEYLRRQRDSGVQQVTLAVGPADGWSAAARARAQLQLSFGAMTLPHELALVIAAEQVYRALTILAGHPYHSGHG